MNKQPAIDDKTIMNKIHYIRHQKVMLDKDLAELYGIEPRRLRQQVRRNKVRFPETFMFQLTEDELEKEVTQFVSPIRQYFGGHLPYVFTEHGVLMLTNVLKSERAVAVSLRLIEIFVRMRELLSAHKDILLKLEQLEKKVTTHDADIQNIFKALKQLIVTPPLPRERIGFKRKNETDPK